MILAVLCSDRVLQIALMSNNALFSLSLILQICVLAKINEEI